MNTNETWAQFGRTIEEAEKTFRMADAAVRTSPLLCSSSIVPLTWRNRLRFIQLAFSKAKRVHLPEFSRKQTPGIEAEFPSEADLDWM